MRHLLNAVLVTGATLTLSGHALGQVAFYRFEEGSGSQYLNSVNNQAEGSGNLNYLTDVPMTLLPQTQDTNGFCVGLNGAQQGQFTPSFVFNSANGDATLEFWINAPDQGHASIIWSRSDDSDANRYNISINPGGVIGVDYREPNSTLHPLGSFGITTNQWTHVAIVRTVNSSSLHTYNYYVDGQQVNTVTDTNPNPPNNQGWAVSGRSGFRMTGALDEIRCTASALASSQFLVSPAVVVVPSLVTINLGRVTGGNLASLATPDNDLLTLCKFFVPNQTSPIIQFVVEGTSTATAPKGIQLRVRSKAVNPGTYAQDMEAWDFVANTYVNLRSDPVTLVSVTRDGMSTTNVGRFFNGSGLLRARVRLRQTGPSTSTLPCLAWDMVSWRVIRPNG